MFVNAATLPKQPRTDLSTQLFHEKVDLMDSKISQFFACLKEVSTLAERIQDEKPDQVVTIGGEALSGFIVFENLYLDAVSKFPNAPPDMHS